MADLKISQLTGATTPLAGTEVLPIVQGGATKQVSVANLTAGRAVDTAALTASGLATMSVGVVVGAGSFAQAKLYTSATNGTIITGKTGTTNDFLLAAAGGNSVIAVPTNTEDVRIVNGNLIVGTAGKGVSLPGNITWISGSGSPEGVVTAPVGSLYSRSDGGAGTSLYVKQSGSGNTGWVGK